MSELLLDATGRRRSPATPLEFHAGRWRRDKGMRSPPDRPTIEKDRHGHAPGRVADRCSCDAATAAGVAKSGWTIGPESSSRRG